MVAVPSPIEEAIERVSDRLKLRVFVGSLCHGVTVASAAGVVFAVLDHFLYSPVSLPVILFTLYFAAVVYAFARMALARLTTFSVARHVEEKLGLKERLSSALSLDSSATKIDPVFRRLQHQDADFIAKQVSAVDITAVAPRSRIGWAAGSVAVLLLSLVVLHFMPADFTRRAEQFVVAQQAAALADTARRIERTAPPHSDAQAEAQELERLAKQLQGGMPRREARQHVQQMAQNVAYRQQQLAGPGQQAPLTPAETGQAIQQAAESQSGGATGSATDDARQMILSGAHEMQQTNDAETLPTMLRRLASHVESRASTPADQQGIANQLDKLSDGLNSAGMPETQSHVDKASAALRAGDKATAASELRQAADAAERESQNAQGLKDVRQALQQSDQSLGGANRSDNQGYPQSQQNDAQGGQGQQSSGRGEQGGGSGQQGAGQQGGTGGQEGGSQSGGQSGQSGRGGQSGQSGSQGGQSGGSGQQSNQGGESGSQGSAGSGQSGSSGSSGGQTDNKTGSGEPGEGSQKKQDSGGGSDGGSQGSGGGGGSQGGDDGSQNGGGSGSDGGSQDGGGPSDGGGNGGRTDPGQINDNRDSGQDRGGSTGAAFHGAPRQLDGYDPTKSPGYSKLNLPHPEAGGQTVVHKTGRFVTPPKSTAPSAVPYGDEYPVAQKSSEEAVDRQSVPPAYRKAVDSYFQGIAPTK